MESSSESDSLEIHGIVSEDDALKKKIKLTPKLSRQLNNNAEEINDEGREVEEDEEDLIVLGVNDDDKLGMSVDDDEEEEAVKSPSDTEKKRTSLKRVKVKKKKKHKKQKKPKTKDVEDAVDAVEPEAGPSAEEISAAKRRRRRERLEAQVEKEKLSDELGDKVILNESSVYSEGNYCSRMLTGQACEEIKCKWSHFMIPRDAAHQFKKILQYRPLEDALQFFSYFTNLEIQEDLIGKAIALLEDLGEETMGLNAKDVCREVYKEMFKNIQILDLSLEHFMELIDISTKIYDVKDGQENLVELFNKTHLLLRDSKTQKAEAMKLVKWAWSHLYLVSVDTGLVLPLEFYTDLSTMLFAHKMIDQLAEILLYTSLLPGLSPSLASLADLLNPASCPPDRLLCPHSTAVFTAQALARLPVEDWQTLHSMTDIKPGLQLLLTNLIHDDPADTWKFYESVPEMEGLEIPEVSTPPSSTMQDWIQERINLAEWDEMARRFCSFEAKEVVILADMTETMVVKISQLDAEMVRLAFQAGMEVVLETRGEEKVHSLFWTQVGLGLLLNQVCRSEWTSASQIISLLTSKLQIDWLHIRPPSLNIFHEIERGMVTLFVLEVLVNSKQSQELVKYLNMWNSLSCLQSEVAVSKRDAILLSVLELLIKPNQTDCVETLVAALDVMSGSMKENQDKQMKKRQEMVCSQIIIMMINHNLDGRRLFAKFKLIRACEINLDGGLTRGLVMSLASARNNMVREATLVYNAGVRWGIYCSQNPTRPFILRLNSALTLEEMSVILQTFLKKLPNPTELEPDQTLTIYINMEEVTVPHSGVTILNRVGSRKKEAMFRLETVVGMRPPLKLTKEGSVPFIEERLVKLYLGKNY